MLLKEEACGGPRVRGAGGAPGQGQTPPGAPHHLRAPPVARAASSAGACASGGAATRCSAPWSCSACGGGGQAARCGARRAGRTPLHADQAGAGRARRPRRPGQSDPHTCTRQTGVDCPQAVPTNTERIGPAARTRSCVQRAQGHTHPPRCVCARRIRRATRICPCTQGPHMPTHRLVLSSSSESMKLLDSSSLLSMVDALSGGSPSSRRRSPLECPLVRAAVGKAEWGLAVGPLCGLTHLLTQEPAG